MQHFPLKLHQPDNAHVPKPHEFQAVEGGWWDLPCGGTASPERNSKKKKKKKTFGAKSEMETSPHFPLLSFSLKPMISSPGPTKVVIIMASGREPVTHHYTKVESHPARQIVML